MKSWSVDQDSSTVTIRRLRFYAVVALLHAAVRLVDDAKRLAAVERADD